MTSIILIWRNSDKSDIRVACDETGEPLLFEFKLEAIKYANGCYDANGYYGSRSGKIIGDWHNYKVVEL